MLVLQGYNVVFQAFILLQNLNAIHMLCCGGHGRSCGGLERTVYLNFFITNGFSLLLSRSKVPNEIEYDYLVQAGDLLALSQLFPLYFEESGKYLLPHHSQCLTCLWRVSLGSNTLPNGSCTDTFSMCICMQGVGLIFDGQHCIFHCFSCCYGIHVDCCLIDNGQFLIQLLIGISY